MRNNVSASCLLILATLVTMALSTGHTSKGHINSSWLARHTSLTCVILGEKKIASKFKVVMAPPMDKDPHHIKSGSTCKLSQGLAFLQQLNFKHFYPLI